MRNPGADSVSEQRILPAPFGRAVNYLGWRQADVIVYCLAVLR